MNQLSETKLTIRRTTSYADRMRKYIVILDDQTIGTLSAKETITVDVSTRSHRLVIKIDWCSSNLVNFDCIEGDDIAFDCGSNLGGFRIFSSLLYITFLRHKYLWLRRLN